MQGFIHYGFLIYYPFTANGAADPVGYIGSKVAKNERIKGDVMFRRSQLKNIKIKNNRFYLMRYTLEEGGIRSMVKEVEVITSFDKSQYPGRLQVDGMGEVTFVREDGTVHSLYQIGDNPKKELLPVSAPVAGADSQSEASGEGTPAVDYSHWTMEDLCRTISFAADLRSCVLEHSQDQLGRNIASFTVPYSMFLEEGEENRRFGLVNYFSRQTDVSKPKFSQIRRTFCNKAFRGIDNVPAPIGIFSNEEEGLDYSAVGRIATGVSVYVVKYTPTDEYIPMPDNPEASYPLAEDLVFLMKVPNKRVVQVDIAEDGIRVKLCLDNLFAVATRESTMEGSAEMNLNSFVSQCLKNGMVQDGLDRLERDREHVGEETYGINRFRLLQKKLKMQMEGGEDVTGLQKEFIRCIDQLLEVTGRTSYRMLLTLEKGKTLLRMNERERARETFKQWLSSYEDYVKANPREIAGLRVSYTQAMHGLQMCQGEPVDSQYSEKRLDAKTEEPVDSLILLDDFILEMAEKCGCNDLGSKFERFEDLTGLTEEDAEELALLIRRFCEEELSVHRLSDPEGREGSNRRSRRFWAMAKMLMALDDAPVPVMDAEEVEKYRNLSLRMALLEETYNLINWSEGMEKDKGGAFKRAAAQFMMNNLLTISQEDEDIVAAIGTLCLKPEEITKALEGGLTLTEVLVALRGESLETVVRGMAELCYRNVDLKRRIGAMLEQFRAEADEKSVEAVKECLCRFSGKGGSITEAFEDAVEEFKYFSQEFLKLTVTDRLAVVSVQHREFLNNPEFRCWVAGDTFRTGRLHEIFLSLSEYDTVRGFSEKSRKIKKANEDVYALSDMIQKQPSILSYYLYVRFLDEWTKSLLETYRQLCKTSKPLLNIEQIEETDRKGGIVNIAIPVISGSNNVQDARQVILYIKESPYFKVQNGNTVYGRDSIPSDGRREYINCTLELHNPAQETIPIEVRLEYRYIKDIKIEEIRQTRKRGGRRRIYYRSQEIMETTGVPPQKGTWISMDLSVQKEEKRTLSLDRVNQFSDDGNLDQSDEGVQRILKNRETLICNAMEGLSRSVNGQRVLSAEGRWVMLYGQWRVGKTVILNCIEARLRKKEDFPHTVVLKLSCSGSDQERFDDFFATAIYCELKKQMRRSEYLPVFSEVSEYNGVEVRNPKVTWSVLGDLMAEFIEDIREIHEDAAVVLLVDEFTEIYQAIIKGHVGVGFPSDWTKFISESKILCVTAGGEHTVSLMETYAPNTLQKAEERIYVRYLELKDVQNYVRYVMGELEEDHIPPAQSYFTSATSSAIDRIYELTQGNTYLLKNLCKWIIEYINVTKRSFLTKTVVEGTISYMVQKYGQDVDSLETTYFNSLYNPFNETQTSDGTGECVKRIEDDIVKEDNQKILHEIVRRADRETHLCSYDELAGALADSMAREGDPEVFKRRFDTLKQRKIIEVDSNSNVRISIDLYYEIVSKIRREG